MVTTQTDPSFDALYVISDLHMGGVEGFQIFGAGPLLGQTIDQLRDTLPEQEIGLVINGDTVDFIAEPKAEYFDPVGAVDKLNRITSDPAFKPVWNALTRFVRTPKRTLLINLGNHDLELALPRVKERLLQILTGGDTDLRGRIRLVFDGTGVCCRVGNASVLCLHGNEVDNWNICDYESLRRQGKDLHFNADREPWIPNAGTQLVVDVMNQIKRKYPFVDLLKPELEAVVPTLYALDPSLRPKLANVFGVAKRWAKDTLRRSTGFLESARDIEEPGDSQQDLEALLVSTLIADRPSDGSTVETPQTKGAGSLEGLESTRGAVDALTGLIQRQPKHEILRRAMEGLTENRGFRFDEPDDTFRKTDELVGKGVDFLVTGHTHMHRAHPRSREGFYFNSGTWVRLIQLSPEVLRDTEKFKRYYDAFEHGTMSALDNEPGMILNRPTVVSICSRGSRVEGSLCNATQVDSGIELTTLDDTTFTVG